MELHEGDILLVCIRRTYGDDDLLSGNIVRLKRTYEGSVDLSYHGSPWYEQFIVAENLENGEVREYGDQTYKWVVLRNYMRNLKSHIEKIKDELKYI